MTLRLCCFQRRQYPCCRPGTDVSAMFVHARSHRQPGLQFDHFAAVPGGTRRHHPRTWRIVLLVPFLNALSLVPVFLLTREDLGDLASTGYLSSTSRACYSCFYLFRIFPCPDKLVGRLCERPLFAMYVPPTLSAALSLQLFFRSFRKLLNSSRYCVAPP